MTIQEALRRVRREYRGLLAVGERFDPVRFVLDPAAGTLVLPVTVDALAYEAVTVHIPDDSDEEGVSLLGEPVEIDPDRHAGPDRFRVYFGDPKARHWIALKPDSVKLSGRVLGVSEGGLKNPWHAHEPAMCKALNADPMLVASLAALATSGLSPADPRAVGVDSEGLDIRAAFGIIRVEFVSRPASPGELMGACRAVLARVS